MHPFCCISTVSDQTATRPVQDHIHMALTARSDSNLVSPVPNHRSHTRSSSIDFGNIRHSHRVLSIASRSASAREPIQVDVKINDIVGNGISGILYKWVNYGKGWRPRWFVLQDGVLSYYKIHGPDKIVVNQVTEKGSKVIGDESMRRIAARPKSNNSQYRRKPVGEVHLKVSSIRESRSDDKRFSIFTGTKRLHLRAETRDDRFAWMEALQAVKDMFPRMSNSELMAPSNNVTVSTENLRHLLEEEGVREAAIQESEQIMRNEFAALQSQIVLLKQKQWLLIDTLRQLETEKVDLENTVVDESQRQQLNDLGATSISREDKFSG